MRVSFQRPAASGGGMLVGLVLFGFNGRLVYAVDEGVECRKIRGFWFSMSERSVLLSFLVVFPFLSLSVPFGVQGGRSLPS